MTLPATAKIAFGGDYNPQQWPEPVGAQDYRLFDLAGIDMVTLGVFDWALSVLVLREDGEHGPA